MRFIVAGGGTGGHIYPALAIARGILERFPGAEVLYVGTNSGMEADIVPREGLAFRGITAAGLVRKVTVRNLSVLWRFGTGFLEARRIVREWRPDAAIGTGGYACGPVILAAALARVPTLIHEQNALPGITNRLLSRFAGMVAVTFDDSRKYFPRKAKVLITGLPVRPEILRANREAGLKNLGLPPGRFIIFSFGGSRGARSINRAMLPVIDHFKDDPALHIMHVTGKELYGEFCGDCERKGIKLDKTGNVTIVPYLYNIADAMAVAGLVISRAGAATLAELTALGIPSILVPYPYAAENHQEYNARALERRGAAVVILDRHLKGELLISNLKELLNNRGKLDEMAEAARKFGRPDALSEIIRNIDNLLHS